MKTAVRRVLVTGASRGIGKAIAISLARSGFHIVVHYRQEQARAEEVVHEIQALGSNASLIQFDISERQETRQKILACLEEGAFYGVVANAGIVKDGPFPSLSEDDWDSVLRTNLDSFYNVLHPLIMPMVQARHGGRIVTLSSVAGIVGHRGQVNYSAAKAGIIGATKSLAQELAKRAITVNCVAPGLIETDMTSSLSAEQRDEIAKAIPLRRLGTAEEVAAAVSFLFSDAASYITGQVLSVNGGLA